MYLLISLISIFPLTFSLSANALSLTAPTVLLEEAVANSPIQNADFFENSNRRDATDNEKRFIVQLLHKDRGVCTGFFVKNTGSKAFVGTARHCVSYQMTKACSEKNVKVKSPLDGSLGTCKRVVAGSNAHDFIIIEMEFPNWAELSSKVGFFTLSSKDPTEPVWLRMIGYPGDSIRKGQLTTTENCWNRTTGNTIYQDLTVAERGTYNTWSSANQTTAEEKAAIALLGTFEYAMYHNCSVYGGNSGGPIFHSESGAVLGLPTAYYPTIMRVFPKTSVSYMSSMARFVSDHKAALTTEGITTVNPF